MGGLFSCFGHKRNRRPSVQPHERPLDRSPPDQSSHLASHDDTTVTTDPVVIHPQPMAHSHPAARGVTGLREVFRLLQRSNACRRWRDLGRELGLEEWVFEAISHNNRDIREQMYKMLLEWEETMASKATQSHLISALKRCSLNKVADMVEDLCNAQANPVLEGSHMNIEKVEQIRKNLTSWYGEKLSKLHPIPWYNWKEINFSHMFTNLQIAEGRKHQNPEQQKILWLPDFERHSPLEGNKMKIEYSWTKGTNADLSLTLIRDTGARSPKCKSNNLRPGECGLPRENGSVCSSADKVRSGVGENIRTSQTIHTEEGLVASLWGSTRRTVSFIEGTAGIGKSCLCRRLVLSWANNDLPKLREKFTLMLILEARTLIRSLKECTRQLFAEDFPLTSDDINQCVTECQEKCLFIIDGVDELTREGKQVVQELLGGTRFRDANVLLTGRPESAKKYIKYVDKHLRITGFTWENTQLYIHKFFNDSQRHVRDKLIHRMKQDTNLQELSRTPFTTLLMCLLAEDSDGDIPDSLNDIMNDIVHLTARRYISRRKETSREDTTVNVEAILRAAAQVAYKGETTGTVVFEESDLETICTHDMSDHLLLSGLFNRDFILSRLDTRGCCYFPHKSIQDFLCARYLADLDLDSLKTTLAQNSHSFVFNPTLCEMLLNMLRDQADKYGTAMTFYWSARNRECVRAVVRSALTVTDGGTLDTIIGGFCQYLSVGRGDLRYIFDEPGGVRLYNLIVRRMGPVLVIMCPGRRIDQNMLKMCMIDEEYHWVPYTRTTPDPAWGHAQYVRILVNREIHLSYIDTRSEMCQGVTLPWVSTVSLRDAIKHPFRINVLCVCVIPTAKCITSLSSLIDRPRSSDLIVFILKPRTVTYEDSVYLRVLEMCKRAHSNPVRVSSCTVVTEVETKKVISDYIRSNYQLSISPLQIHYDRHCPF